MSREPKKKIEDLVRELERYPMDAFLFVQECLGIAANKAHGPMSQDEEMVVKWMALHDVDLEALRELADSSQLPPDINDAVERIGGVDDMNRHVTGQQVCWAVRDTAIERWGLMAKSVLARWGIESTRDIGAIIFALVESNWLQKQSSDKLDDFNDVFSFDEALDKEYRIGTA